MPTPNPSVCLWFRFTLIPLFPLKHLSGLGRFPRLLLLWVKAIRVYRGPEGYIPQQYSLDLSRLIFCSPMQTLGRFWPQLID